MGTLTSFNAPLTGRMIAGSFAWERLVARGCPVGIIADYPRFVTHWPHSIRLVLS